MSGLGLILLTILISYLIGAIPFGYLIARWRGVDIFKVGSGNVGATNVGRALGRRFGILVFILDFAKGAIPVAACRLLVASNWQLATGNWPPIIGHDLPVLAGISAILGHIFPVFLRFRGGKGVATGAGVVAVLLPGPALGALITWIVIVALTRYVSLASLAAAVSFCLFHVLLTHDPFDSENWLLTYFAFVAVGLVFARHHANIRRLLRGNENRLPESPFMTQIPKIIHVLAVGLWFGSTVFFVMVALVVFNNFETLGASSHRPSWMPLPADFDQEKGTRLAGVALAPVFEWYFPLQIICGFLAIMTGLSFSEAERSRGLHRARNMILLMATLSVVIGWLVADYVAELRLERYSSNPAVAESAKAIFGAWHGISLTLNMITIALVTAAMAMASQLPQIREQGSGVRNQESGIRPETGLEP